MPVLFLSAPACTRRSSQQLIARQTASNQWILYGALWLRSRPGQYEGIVGGAENGGVHPLLLLGASERIGLPSHPANIGNVRARRPGGHPHSHDRDDQQRRTTDALGADGR
jgi:hypothetical protein